MKTDLLSFNTDQIHDEVELDGQIHNEENA